MSGFQCCYQEGTGAVGTTGGGGALFGLGTAAIVHDVFQGKKRPPDSTPEP
jgi:hypothetical protein